MASRIGSLFYRVPVFIAVLLALPFITHFALLASEKAGFTPHDLAYYLDESQINFIRPGLKLRIQAVTVENQRFVVRFRLTDPRDLPLDRSGVYTPGAVSTSFIGAYIPKTEQQYRPYVTRSVTSPINNRTVTQPTTDSGGTYRTVADGEYTYTFGNTVTTAYDPTTTQTIGMYASRDLTEFDLGRQYDNDVFSFVPDGTPVTLVRDVVRTENCNQCHDPLAMHGGSRRDTRLCILCHVPGAIDPDTGNTIDFKVMVHKIHRGHDLPSVQAGTPYVIIGNRQSIHDFSTVAFPNDVRNCEVCHKTATQGNHYLTNPSRAACGSCHDTVNFATGEGHVDQPQISDNMCSTCHIPQGEREFDASIKGAHTRETFSEQLRGTTFGIVRVENTSAGQQPTVTFTIKDRAGNVIDASAMDSLSLVLAGPTTDYSRMFSENARGATRVGNEFRYTFTAAVPADATGSYAVAIQGYRNIKLNEATRQEMTVRDAGFNEISYFSLRGGPAVARRQIVDVNKCNVCHGRLALHGGSRRNTQFCVMCHNPNGTDTARRTAATMPPESIHFKNLIHKIHTGEELTSDFTVYGYGGNPYNFNEVRFPGDRRNCEKCHLPGTYELPLAENVLPTQTPRGFFPVTQPVAAACLGCHTSRSTAAHASIMTSPTLGESCDVCHGRNADFGVAKVHAR